MDKKEIVSRAKKLQSFLSSHSIFKEICSQYGVPLSVRDEIAFSISRDVPPLADSKASERKIRLHPSFFNLEDWQQRGTLVHEFVHFVHDLAPSKVKDKVLKKTELLARKWECMYYLKVGIPKEKIVQEINGDLAQILAGEWAYKPIEGPPKTVEQKELVLKFIEDIKSGELKEGITSSGGIAPIETYVTPPLKRGFPGETPEEKTKRIVQGFIKRFTSNIKQKDKYLTSLSPEKPVVWNLKYGEFRAWFPLIADFIKAPAEIAGYTKALEPLLKRLRKSLPRKK